MQTEKQKTSENISDFLSWFQREYLNRRNKNSNYSIRAFALYLNIAAPTVSHLLSGKRKPSQKFVKNLFKRLNASPKEQEVILSSIKSSKVESEKLSAIAHYHQIALDSFKVLADWYHYAILEMTSVKSFKSNFAWIANQLDLSVPEVQQAVERLIRLELLEEKGKSLVKTKSFVTNYDEGYTSSALKKLQRDLMLKALEAIDFTPSEDKDITSMTMAIDESKIPEAKKKIKKFRRELCAFLEDGAQTRVFNLGIQLYPISKKLTRELK